MPRPMKPTQFTVLTNASASALRMSPVASSIIDPDPVLVVPPRADIDRWLVRRRRDGGPGPCRDRGRMNADGLDKVPGKGVVEEKLGLLGLLHGVLAEVSG